MTQPPSPLTMLFSRHTKRREFIALLGGAAAWPMAAQAQPDRVPRIALFMGIADDAEGRRRAAAFRQALQQLGWKEGSNVRIDERWGVADTDVIRALAIQLNPSVIVVQGARAVPILQQATKTIPIVFVSISDPVGRGIVTNMARPGGNITGFQLFEFSVIGKLLEALKEIAPKVSRVACLVNPDNPAADFHVRSFETVAPSLAVQPLIARVHNSADIAQAIEAFSDQNGGLLLPPDDTTIVHRKLVVTLAARHRLPAVYSFRSFVADVLRRRRGGFVSSLRVLRRSNSERGEARRAACPGAHPVRAEPQSADRQGARPRSAADAPRPRRRGDRMTR
jgi:putative tryptophan/tyrosine transport system substrate-binding protein